MASRIGNLNAAQYCQAHLRPKMEPQISNRQVGGEFSACRFCFDQNEALPRKAKFTLQMPCTSSSHPFVVVKVFGFPKHVQHCWAGSSWCLIAGSLSEDASTSVAECSLDLMMPAIIASTRMHRTREFVGHVSYCVTWAGLASNIASWCGCLRCLRCLSNGLTHIFLLAKKQRLKEKQKTTKTQSSDTVFRWISPAQSQEQDTPREPTRLSSDTCFKR